MRDGSGMRGARCGVRGAPYRLLATKKTSTMQKELAEAGDQGYEFVGMTVAKTLVGGEEVVAILRRKL